MSYIPLLAALERLRSVDGLELINSSDYVLKILKDGKLLRTFLIYHKPENRSYLNRTDFFNWLEFMGWGDEHY